MDSRFYLIDLYDIYGELLTDKQKAYFKDYYYNNLTLSELSENYNVSRNAIHKQLKETEEKLNHYEKILKIKEKNKKIRELCSSLDKETLDKLDNLL